MDTETKDKIKFLDFMRINADDFNNKQWIEIINKLNFNRTYLWFKSFINDALSYFYSKNLFYIIAEDLKLNGDEDIIKQIIEVFSIKEAVIPNNITVIGNEVFQSCNDLHSVTIPKSVKSIEKDAFFSCINLQNVTIPEGVTSIGDSAFSYCKNLQSITIPEGVTSIGDSAFSGCSSLQSITIPDSVTSIGWNAFKDCYKLKNINAPNDMKQWILNSIKRKLKNERKNKK